jgi:hypothetical protein
MILESILGGVTGLIGNALTAWSNYKTQKLKNEHDEKMYDFKIKEVAAKTDAAIKITQAKITGAVEIADSQAYTESQKVGNQKSFSDSWIEKLMNTEGWLKYLAIPVAVLMVMLLGFVDVLKGFMRPGLTLYLTLITTWITYKAYDIMQTTGTEITSAQAFALYSEVTSIVIYLTVSCVTWWFGDRRMAKFMARMQRQNSGGAPQVVNRPGQDIEKPDEEHVNKPNPNEGVIPK